MEVIDIIIWEGVWGMALTSIFLGISAYFKGTSNIFKEDIIFASYQVINSREI
jgi:hypothetical protein